MPKLDAKNSVIGGVCAGLAKHLKINVLFIRLGFIFMFLWAGAGLLPYIILWLLMPRDGDE